MLGYKYTCAEDGDADVESKELLRERISKLEKKCEDLEKSLSACVMDLGNAVAREDALKLVVSKLERSSQSWEHACSNINTRTLNLEASSRAESVEAKILATVQLMFMKMRRQHGTELSPVEDRFLKSMVNVIEKLEW